MNKLIYAFIALCAASCMAIADDTVFTDTTIDGTLTIDGAILIPVSTVAPSNSVAATGHVASATAVALKHGESVTINDQTYTFTTNTLAAANEVAIAAVPVGVAGHTNSVGMTNLFLAVTVGGTNNPTLYYTTTVKPSNITATKVDPSTIKFTSDAGYHGALGNAFVLTRSGVNNSAGTNLTVSGAGTLTGGTPGTVGESGSVMLCSTGLYFTTQDSTLYNAVWTTK